MPAYDLSPDTLRIRELLRVNRRHIDEILRRYHASNPRVYGSVARGTARPDSDLDLLVDMDEDAPDGSSRLLRLSGIQLDLQDLLKVEVDVAYEDILKRGVSDHARRELQPLE